MHRPRSFSLQVLLVGFVVGIALTLALGTVASADKKKEHGHDYLVTAGTIAACADNAGSFEGTYNGKNIVVNFRYGTTSGHEKHGKHGDHDSYGVRVYENGKLLADPTTHLCPKPGESGNKIAGTRVRISGHWKDDTHLEAHMIRIGKLKTLRPAPSPGQGTSLRFSPSEGRTTHPAQTITKRLIVRTTSSGSSKILMYSRSSAEMVPLARSCPLIQSMSPPQ